MDKLDRYSAWAVAVLLVWLVFLVVREGGGPGPEGQDENGAPHAAVIQRYLDPDFAARISLAKKLIWADNLDKAATLLAELNSRYPHEALPYMLLGDIALRRQDIMGAVTGYRRAVDLNPDFLDRRSKDFQGKKIKKAVEEALSIMEKANDANGSAGSFADGDRQLIYYMLRKIAGSCG